MEPVGQFAANPKRLQPLLDDSFRDRSGRKIEPLPQHFLE
jgi:hypothetical protein